MRPPHDTRFTFFVSTPHDVSLTCHTISFHASSPHVLRTEGHCGVLFFASFPHVSRTEGHCGILHSLLTISFHDTTFTEGASVLCSSCSASSMYNLWCIALQGWDQRNGMAFGALQRCTGTIKDAKPPQSHPHHRFSLLLWSHPGRTLAPLVHVHHHHFISF